MSFDPERTREAVLAVLIEQDQTWDNNSRSGERTDYLAGTPWEAIANW